MSKTKYMLINRGEGYNLTAVPHDVLASMVERGENILSAVPVTQAKIKKGNIHIITWSTWVSLCQSEDARALEHAMNASPDGVDATILEVRPGGYTPDTKVFFVRWSFGEDRGIAEFCLLHKSDYSDDIKVYDKVKLKGAVYAYSQGFLFRKVEAC